MTSIAKLGLTLVSPVLNIVFPTKVKSLMAPSH